MASQGVHCYFQIWVTSVWWLKITPLNNNLEKIDVLDFIEFIYYFQEALYIFMFVNVDYINHYYYCMYVRHIWMYL